MPLLVDPVPSPVASRLRVAVAELHRRTARVRSRFPAQVRVSVPDSCATFTAPTGDPLDHSLRSDVVSVLIEEVAPAGTAVEVALERRGTTSWHDQDAAWLAASRQACAEHGVELTFVVLTRHGWYDPRGGASRAWVRPRARQSQV